MDYKWRKYISQVWIIVGQRDNNNEWHVRFSRISWYIIPRRSVIVIYRDASLMCLQRVFLHFWVFDSRLNNFLSRFLTILVVIFFHIWLAVAMSNLAILFFNCKIFNFTVQEHRIPVYKCRMYNRIAILWGLAENESHSVCPHPISYGVNRKFPLIFFYNAKGMLLSIGNSTWYIT